jgi:hypothetical protein
MESFSEGAKGIATSPCATGRRTTAPMARHAASSVTVNSQRAMPCDAATPTTAMPAPVPCDTAVRSSLKRSAAALSLRSSAKCAVAVPALVDGRTKHATVKSCPNATGGSESAALSLRSGVGSDTANTDDAPPTSFVPAAALRS